MSSESQRDEEFYEALTRALEARESGAHVDFDRLSGSDPDVAARLRRVLDFDETVDVAFSMLRDDSSRPPNRAVGAFRLIEEIGGGASARVYLAHDDRLQRFVALKEFGRNALAGDPSARVRFHREARLAASLDHPGIVPIYEVGETADEPWIAMKLLSGPALSGVGIMLPRRAAEIGRAVATTLAFAHERGVIHRDVKPGNIILDLDRPVLVDFGLARSVLDTRMTREGQIPGTLPYLAPELILDVGAVQGESSDLYALGATLYELVAGRPPFGFDQPEKVLRRLAFEDARPLSLSPSDRDFGRIVDKCLAKDPHRRYPHAADLADDLSRFLAGEPIVGRAPGRWNRFARMLRRRRGVVVATAVALVVAVGWLGSTIDDRRADDAKFDTDIADIRAALEVGDVASARRVLSGIDRSRRYLGRVDACEREVSAVAATEDLLDVVMARRELLSANDLDGCLAAARAAEEFEGLRHDYHAAAAIAEMFRGDPSAARVHVDELSRVAGRCCAVEATEAFCEGRRPKLDAPILHEQDQLISILVLRATGASIEERQRRIEIARDARPTDSRLTFSFALLSLDRGLHDVAAAAFDSMNDTPRLEPFIRRHEARSQIASRAFDRARKTLERIPPAARRPIDVVLELSIDAWTGDNDRVRDTLQKHFGDRSYVVEPDVGLFAAQWKSSVGDTADAVAILRELSEKAKSVFFRHRARADLIILLLDLYQKGSLSAEDTEDLYEMANDLAKDSNLDLARSRGLYVAAMLGDRDSKFETLTRSAAASIDEYYPRLQIANDIVGRLLASRPLEPGKLLDDATQLTEAEQGDVDEADRRLREVEAAGNRSDRWLSDPQLRALILLRLLVGAYRRDRSLVLECLERAVTLVDGGRWPETEGAPYLPAYRKNFGR